MRPNTKPFFVFPSFFSFYHKTHAIKSVNGVFKNTFPEKQILLGYRLYEHSFFDIFKYLNCLKEISKWLVIRI